jgi:peptide/nickel transport system substrate-binding protein
MLIFQPRARLRVPMTASRVGSLAPANRSLATEMSPAFFARTCMLLLVAGVLLALSGCGGDDGGDDDAEAGGGRQGGSITIAQSSQPDFLDPALSYTLSGWEPMWLVYTPPLTYRRAEGEEGAELIPGVAEALPEISPDGRSYKLTLRGGLRYSDGAPAKASDFEHTIKRVLNLESGASAMFLGIEGAEDYVDAGRAEADIPGIETDDRTGEITIKLTEPDGTFSNVLAMNFAGLVPGDTPFQNLTKDPPPGIGPYMITESEPNRRFVLERNDRFNLAGIPRGNLDRITTVIVASRARQAQDVISGELDYMQDPPPPDLKPEVKAEYSDRYEEHTRASTYYVFLNVRVPPFDKREVREAVNYGIDKPALARLFAGELAPGCSFLPPGLPGYDRALDVEACPWGDPTEPPDLEKARQLISDAGAEGAKVAVYGESQDPHGKAAEAYADMLNKIGLDATPKIVDSAVYYQTIGSAETQAQTGLTTWLQDFPHPKNFFSLVDGKSIQPTNNLNPGNVDDPGITSTIAELSKEPELTGEVASKWGELNQQLVEEAWIAPYGHVKGATFMSERMDFENCSLFHPVYNNDYSSFCLK